MNQRENTSVSQELTADQGQSNGSSGDPTLLLTADQAISAGRPRRYFYQENKKLILLAALFAPLLSVVDVVIVNIAIPFIKDQFGATDSSVELVVAVYLLGYSIFLVTGSRAGDYFGRKKVYVAAMIAFTLSSLLCGIAGSIVSLIIYRFIQGVAAAFMVPQAITIIQLTFTEPHQRDKAFGFYGISLGLAAIVGQFLGGYFVSTHFIAEGWRLIFLVNLPIGLIAMGIALLCLKETRQNKAQRFDVAGVALLTPGLICLLYPIIQGRELGWPLWCIALLVLSLLLLTAFLFVQKRKSENNASPLLHMSLFSFRKFNLGVLAAVFFFGVHNSFLLVSAFYFQRILHIAPYPAGLYFTLYGAGFLVASYTSIRNISRFGIRMLQFGTFLMIGSLVLQAWLFPAYVSPWSIRLLLLLYGLGQGLILPSILNTALRSIPLEYAGVAGGVYSTIQQFSSALGISVVGGVFFYFLNRGGVAYTISLYVMIGYLVVGLFLLQAIKKNG